MTAEYAEMVADIVVDNGLAVVWSQRIDGDDPEAGKKARSGWNHAEPWSAGKQNLLAHLHSYHGKRNLLVVTDASNVVTIDCDTPVGLERYYELGLPETLTVKSGRGDGGMHFVHRPPPYPLQYTFFELAGEKDPIVSGAASKKLHVLAGIHKTGREYEIILRSPEDPLEITPMSQEVYDRLVNGYQKRVGTVQRQVYNGVKVAEPGRHDYLVGWAQAYLKMGKRGELLYELLKAERDCACELGPRLIDDAEIRRMANWVESRG